MTLLTVLLLTGQMRLSLCGAEKAPQAERQEREPCQPYVATQHLSLEKMASPKVSKERGFPR